jgi:hypothetical protein
VRVSTLCAVAPPPGLYGVVGTGLLWAVSNCEGVWVRKGSVARYSSLAALGREAYYA